MISPTVLTELLKNALAAERSKCAGAAMQVAEYQRICGDQKLTIETLRKQVQEQVLSEVGGGRLSKGRGRGGDEGSGRRP